MAKFVFNSQVTVNGKVRQRGDAVLVGWNSTVRTAHINTIVEQINARGNYYFTVKVLDTPFNDSLNVDTGFYHLDDPHPTGNRLVFPDEGDEACERLLNLMQGRADDVIKPRDEVVETDEQPAPVEEPPITETGKKKTKKGKF